MSRKSAFNYSTLNEKHRMPTQAHAMKIHDIVSETAEGIVQIGKRLITIKKTIGIRMFNAWIKGEFRWSQATASNYMRTADKFGNLDCVRNFQPSALIQFTRDRVPKKAVAEAIKIAQSGELVTKSKAVEIVTRHGITASANKPGQIIKPEAWHLLSSNIRKLSEQIEQIVSGIEQHEIDALTDELLQLAVTMKNAMRKASQPTKPKPTQKPKRNRSKSAA